MSIGFWNIQGWNNDFNSDSHKIRSNIINYYDLDIIGLAETHLTGTNTIEVPGYKWIGQNRTKIHPRAKKGSGGVGILVRESLLKAYEISVLSSDNDCEGILWINFRAKCSSFAFKVCVCYLPPKYSSRQVDMLDFFDNLLTQIYLYQKDGLFLICGDFNSRIGNSMDYIEGVDYIDERQVLDYERNQYGDHFIELLLSASCCILNGRNNIVNDFTSVSNSGEAKSVVDYCLVPHEYMPSFTNFTVNRPRVAFNEAGCIGLCDPKSLPDHSLLTWNVDLPVNMDSATTTDTSGIKDNRSYVKYDLKDIPGDFLASPSVRVEIENWITKLEESQKTQDQVTKLYNDFCEIISCEMNDKLEHKTVIIKDGMNGNKRRQTRKPWWSEELTNLWNVLCTAEQAYKKAQGTEKQRKKAIMKNIHKEFDKKVKSAKRIYWRKQQEELLAMHSETPKEFWKYIGELGIAKERKKGVPMEIVNHDGTISMEKSIVLDKWKSDFELLLNPDNVQQNNVLPDFTPHHTAENMDNLNNSIERREIEKALSKAKNGKATGYDSIPMEVLRSEVVVNMLLKLFNVCFEQGIIPETWYKGIISPIPKCSSSDNRIPLNYRGITLASATYKLYCSVINARLTHWAEENEMTADEQNGFRKGRSCQDHLSTLNMIIDSRKKCQLSTYAAFVDFSKAYDRIDRSLLFLKLEAMGLQGSIFSAIKAIYNNVKCCVRLNGYYTDWFQVACGLKQGCLLSPFLFNLYINDLVQELKDLGMGIKIGNETVNSLLYADDLVLLAENESDLQDMLTLLDIWCQKWKMKINTDKTKIVHFRNPAVPKTQLSFCCGDEDIHVIDKYKYLGLIFTEHLDYQYMAKSVADSANRALGVLIVKAKANGGMPFECFSKLYDSLVQSIISYGAVVWGNKEFSCIAAVQNRAGRFYLGVPRSTPTAAVQGEIGWTTSSQRQWISLTRQWCRLCNMDNNRLNKKIFLWAYDQAQIVRRPTWVKKCLTFYQNNNIDLDNILQVLDTTATLQNLETILFEKYKNKWLEELNRPNARHGAGNNKLRTYRTYKRNFITEPYVTTIMGRSQRHALAVFRCGVAPIRLETGRYERPPLPVNQRTCFHCKNDVETEIHVILDCSLYEDIRENLLQSAEQKVFNFLELSKEDKFSQILSNPDLIFDTAKSLQAILLRRRTFFYK